MLIIDQNMTIKSFPQIHNKVCFMFNKEFVYSPTTS